MQQKVITPRFLPFLVSLFVLSLFYIALRLFPLINHNLSYTYDQGRDFLRAAEIVDLRNITFIGPTTGIMGLYHGAWWYYLLTIPYLLFSGAPIGFYYFNFLIQFLSFGLILYFVYHEFGFLKTTFTGLILISAPYFIATSLFVGNNIMAIPSFLFFLVSLYLLEKRSQTKSTTIPLLLLLAHGFSLGLVAEFELSFGIFLLPSYLLTVLVFPKLRRLFGNWKRLALFGIGLGTAFLPRALFEIKNGFAQTKILLGFFIQPKLHNPKPYFDVLRDRIGLFENYYQSLFSHPYVLVAVSALAVFLIIIGIRQKQKSSILTTFLFLFASLFFLSTFYKDNFWGNYYEGIHYLMLGIMLLGVNLATKTKLTSTLLVLLNLVLVGGLFFQLLRIDPKPRIDGLRAHEAAINELYKRAEPNFCLDIYTPPAIPYTYRYIFYNQNRRFQKPLPLESWQNNECWYFIESDDYAERRADWIKSRIPQEAKLKQRGQVGDLSIQLWKK